MDTKNIVVLPGDGVGPEIMQPAVNLLKAIGEVSDTRFSLKEYDFGGKSVDANGSPLSSMALEACKNADAVLLGAVGGPQYDQLPPDIRPEQGLLQLRSELATYCNLRPARLYSGMETVSTLKKQIVEKTDLVVVRELTGGLYFGEPAGIQGEKGQRIATNAMVYSETEIRRIARQAFQLAEVRRGHVTSVDKSDVVEVSGFWRQIVDETAKDYPNVQLRHILMDTAAMKLVSEPSVFDVILTSNMFGDILSDIAATLAGSIGLLPSTSLGEGTPIYEPVHGSAPDIAGQNIVNPIGMLASVAMMFRYSFNQPEVGLCIEEAIGRVLADGFGTADISPKTKVGTMELSEMIIAIVGKRLSDQNASRN